jgi:hypothetical protein
MMLLRIGVFLGCMPASCWASWHFSKVAWFYLSGRPAVTSLSAEPRSRSSAFAWHPTLPGASIQKQEMAMQSADRLGTEPHDEKRVEAE